MSSLHERVRRAMLSSVPADGAAIGNTALRRAIEGLLQAEGLAFGDDDYWQAHAALIAEGVLVRVNGVLMFAIVPDDSSERTLADAQASAGAAAAR